MKICLVTGLSIILLGCIILSACNKDDSTANKVCEYVRMNNIQAIQQLAYNGENIGARGSEELSPLHLAAEFGYLDITKLLVENGVDVNTTTLEWKQAPIVYALQFGHTEIALYLLDNGVNVNGCSLMGASHLNWAVETDLEMVRELLQRGADPNLPDQYGETPLFPAAYSFYQGIEKMELLISAGANIHKKNNNGETALDCILAPEFEGIEAVARNAEYLRNLMK